MRILLSILGVLLAVGGLLGAAAAVGLLGGGTGDRQWFRAALCCFIAGIATLTFANRHRL